MSQYEKCKECGHSLRRIEGTRQERIGFYVESAIGLGGAVGQWQSECDSTIKMAATQAMEVARAILVAEIMSIANEQEPTQ